MIPRLVAIPIILPVWLVLRRIPSRAENSTALLATRAATSPAFAFTS
eukprot:CAMPEP_0169413618 /NCGR_PEP_ID=MMETSP1017-20121227/61447_1 /TAXON_ID=342587 /ORGANISM="Karlodinium micrum, Strain CCMP2283" /LENGTH=46 /DNA_ID= /DNA_START= /DNA_END= /DNA_ORIENTATION=